MKYNYCTAYRVGATLILPRRWIPYPDYTTANVRCRSILYCNPPRVDAISTLHYTQVRCNIAIALYPGWVIILPSSLFGHV